MPYKENLRKATELKTELDGFRPLTPEVEKRIMQKFRLDWNYHSSHIEGNLLTFGETKALLLFGTTAQAKPLKDHLEMKGHNEAILNLEEVIQQKRPLTENFIRELHELILHEPYEVNAITPDGKPTRRTISIGQYKIVPNHVLTKTGEIFYFATPEETPAKMYELLQWYNDNKDNVAIHPVLFATEFHYRFICIHPFDDGNGRIARLLMNFILMLKGYPPAIIKTEDKESYYAALQQADAGDISYFFNYVCEQIIRSLELMIKGAKGEDVEEENDLDKKLALLKQEIEAEDSENEIKLELNGNTIYEIINNWVFELFDVLENTSKKFDQFYQKNSAYVMNNIDSQSINVYLKDFLLNNSNNSLNLLLRENKSHNNAKITYRRFFETYIKGGINPFSCNYSIEIIFDKLTYKIDIGYFDIKMNALNKMTIISKRLLSKNISKLDMIKINSLWGDSLLNHLAYYRSLLKK